MKAIFKLLLLILFVIASYNYPGSYRFACVEPNFLP